MKEAGQYTVPILQMRKPRPQEAKELAGDHTESRSATKTLT